MGWRLLLVDGPNLVPLHHVGCLAATAVKVSQVDQAPL